MPRPILKQSPTSPTTLPSYSYRPHHHPPLAHAAVHFPPSPTLTRTFSAHSPTSYDRSPIVVAPNSCALPERGCPGRTYDLDDAAARAAAASADWSSRCAKNLLLNNHRHPRALSRGYTHPAESNGPSAPYNSAPHQAYNPPSVMPSLVHDFSSSSSSESEESDGLHSPPSEHQEFNPYAPYPARNHIQGLVIPTSSSCNSSYSSGYRDEGSPSTPTPTPLSFLPHPPSPEDEQRSLAHRRRRKRSPNGSGGFTDDSRPKVRSSSSSPSTFTLRSSMSGMSFNESDGGCLGGF